MLFLHLAAVHVVPREGAKRRSRRGGPRLRPAREEDADFFVDLRNDIDLQYLLMARARGSTLAQVTDWLRSRSEGQVIFLVVADRDTDAPAGFIQLASVDEVSRHGDLGICIADAFQGKGYAEQALLTFEAYLRDTLNISKVSLSVLSANRRAIEFYLKLGYREVGTQLAHFYWEGELHDVLLMEKAIGER